MRTIKVSLKTKAKLEEIKRKKSKKSLDKVIEDLLYMYDFSRIP